MVQEILIFLSTSTARRVTNLRKARRPHRFMKPVRSKCVFVGYFYEILPIAIGIRRDLVRSHSTT